MNYDYIISKAIYNSCNSRNEQGDRFKSHANIELRIQWENNKEIRNKYMWLKSRRAEIYYFIVKEKDNTTLPRHPVPFVDIVIQRHFL